ncbi:MAG: thioredoxin domain-containing protein [Alphaproteobacteria bacterium]|nr:thioredoxin domain-containing protein [Alphaproteobacteria bacterium]
MSAKTWTIVAVIMALAAAGGAYFYFNQGGLQSAGNSGSVNANYEALPTDHTMGDPKAKVVVIEYASPTCPVCAHFMTDLFPKVKSDYIDTGKVFWVYRTFMRGPDDASAEKIARCMPKDKYMSFTDSLYRNQSKWDYEFGIPSPDGVHAALVALAGESGMSAADVDKCLASTNDEAAINKVGDDAVAKYQVNATPTFVVNGQPEAGFEHLNARIDAAIAGK